MTFGKFGAAYLKKVTKFASDYSAFGKLYFLLSYDTI